MKSGDRVRMVQTDSKGTIVGDPSKSLVDGGDRVSVEWDKSGIINKWHPGFLRSVGSDPSTDPDEVILGNLARRRQKIEINRYGVTLIHPEGFYKVAK